jgi:hypothetical protein
MRRRVSGALLAAGTAFAVSTATATPAVAATSGSEAFSGVIVTSGVSGDRVISSLIVVKGVFSGTGRIVEIPNLPTDPGSVSRDDLVFAEGTLHLLNTSGDSSFAVNPRSCLLRGTIEQTSVITGGTGRFAAATGSFAGTGSGVLLLARNSDGTCSFEQTALREVDMVAASGTLSF